MQMDQLQSKPHRETPQQQAKNDREWEEDSSQSHTQGVIATVIGMIQCSSSNALSELPSLEYLVDMVHRIKINGFSVCDGEFVCYGVGLYGKASYMNHSCQPNAVQTFLFHQAMLPTLFVTSFCDIPPNEEICISYVDTSYPTLFRQLQLEKNYFFYCNCQACSDLQDDATRMGIRCSDCAASRVVRVDSPVTLAPAIQRYRCESCGRTDFESTLRLLGSFQRQQEELEHNGSSLSSSQVMNTWEEMYNAMKKVCYSYSWYVQQAGENLLQLRLEKLAESSGDPEQEYKIAMSALNLSEELLSGASLNGSNDRDRISSCSTYLGQQQLRYKAAKLRLFLTPDPREAVQELQDVLSNVSPYYHRDHEFVRGLQDCLKNALM
jgi:hypothetical protein